MSKNFTMFTMIISLIVNCLEIDAKTFTGAVNDDWNVSGNWSPSGAPGGGSSIVIDADARISGSPSITVSNLTINSGKQLDVNDATLYIIGNIDNNGALILGNGGSVYQGGNIGGSGTWRVIKKGHSDDRWNYYSSPFGGQPLFKLIANNPSYGIFTLSPNGAPEWGPLDKWKDFHTQSLQTWWINVKNSANTFNRGQGYIAASSGTITFETNNASDVWDGSFSGVSVFGNNSFFLVGNPYMSGLDLGSFAADNAGLVDNTFYFWYQGTPQITWLSGAADDYGAYNVSTSSGVAGSGTLSSSYAPGPVVAAGQSFVVKGIGTGTLQFNNSQRSNGVAFGKKNVNLARFNLISPENKFSQINFTFIDDVIDEKDSKFRSSRRHVGPGSVRFYSVFDGAECAILGLNKLENGDRRIEVRVDASEAGTYKIVLEEMPGLEGMDIILEDMLTGKFHIMNNSSPYAFEVKRNEVVAGRFFLTFKKSSERFNDATINMNIFASENKIVLDCSMDIQEIRNVNVLDVTGRVVASYSAIKPQAIISLPFDAQFGIYMVVVETARGYKSAKILKN